MRVSKLITLNEKALYGGQYGESVCGSWGLKG